MREIELKMSLRVLFKGFFKRRKSSFGMLIKDALVVSKTNITKTGAMSSFISTQLNFL